MLLLRQLERVGEADAVVGQVFLAAGDVVEHRLDVHVGHIVGQQHDFVAVDFAQVLALHVLRAYETRLEQPRDERAGSHERVENMHVLPGQRGAELFPEYVVHRAYDEVHALHGRVDDAELFHRQGERPLEELLVEVLDDGLLPLEVVYAAHVHAHRPVELVQHLGVFLECLFLQEVYHALHRSADGVIPHELVTLEERVEHGAGNHVLRQHLYGLPRVHGRIEVAPETFEVGVELLLVRALPHEPAYAPDELLRNLPYLFRPVLPVQAVAALLHQLGIHPVLKLAEAQFQLARDFRASHLPRLFLPVAETDAGLPDDDRRGSGLPAGLFPVEGDAVHHRVEAVVVGAERVQD